MRGRERAVTDRWVKLLTELTAQLADLGVATGRPLLEGGGVTVTVEPRKDRPVPAVAKAETGPAARPPLAAVPDVDDSEDDDSDVDDSEDGDDDDSEDGDDDDSEDGDDDADSSEDRPTDA